MKFIFDKAYSDAMEGLDNDEDDEKEMKINPNTVSAGDFKKFTCGFMYSTLKSMDLLDEMNTKLDLAISTNSATEERVKTLEGTVTKMEEALDLGVMVNYIQQQWKGHVYLLMDREQMKMVLKISCITLLRHF